MKTLAPHVFIERLLRKLRDLEQLENYIPQAKWNEVPELRAFSISSDELAIGAIRLRPERFLYMVVLRDSFEFRGPEDTMTIRFGSSFSIEGPEKKIVDGGRVTWAPSPFLRIRSIEETVTVHVDDHLSAVWNLIAWVKRHSGSGDSVREPS